MNIKSPSAEEAIRELAALTGESMTSAVELAARERIARIVADQGAPGPRPSETMADDIRAIQQIARASGLTRRQIDDELYDEWGAPR